LLLKKKLLLKKNLVAEKKFLLLKKKFVAEKNFLLLTIFFSSGVGVFFLVASFCC
jgi:hypothetical protein